jgi:hypothetical protein
MPAEKKNGIYDQQLTGSNSLLTSLNDNNSNTEFDEEHESPDKVLNSFGIICVSDNFNSTLQAILIHL